MTHPYRRAPPRSFWKQEMVPGFDPIRMLSDDPLLMKGDRVASAGSCFASNLVPYIERGGFHYVRTERRPSMLGPFAEDNYGYAKFSAAYGNIYTARQAAQLLLRALDRFRPVEDRWVLENGSVIDPFRPGLRYTPASHAEFELLTRFHLERVLEALREATVFVFTLGLTEAWQSRQDGAVLPACPGTIAGTFDPSHHEFRNFSVAEVTEDLDRLVLLAREVNPDLRFVITVSPVPLVATATSEHVLCATTYSKAVLRVAAAEVVRRHPSCLYFPAYEIVTNPLAPQDFWGTDRREPTVKAIDAVMRAFLGRCEGRTPEALVAEGARVQACSDEMRRELSAQVAAAACEEEASQH